MKKINVKESYRVVARLKRLENGERKLEYYLEAGKGKWLYLFTRNYSNTCYDACKSGERVAKLICGRKRNDAYMKLVKHLKRMMPYMMEYYDLKAA